MRVRIKRGGLVERRKKREASPREGLRAGQEEFARTTCGGSAEAHARAVWMVRLTLLLFIIGIALFLFDGPGGNAQTVELNKEGRHSDDSNASFIPAGQPTRRA
jgi:hypothetical protein